MNHTISSECKEAVTRIVAEYRKLRAENLEFELRFGRFQNGQFKAGVTRQMIDKCLTMLQTNPDIKRTDWKEHSDFYYMFHGEQIRTRVTYDSDDLKLVSVSVKKNRIMSTSFPVGNDDLAVRISLSEEIPCTTVSSMTNTDHVRIQQRREFIYGSWRYHFSLAWAGKHKTEAELDQHNNEPTFEIEIEMDPTYLTHNGNEYTALSCIMKALDFVNKPELEGFDQEFSSRI